MNIEELKRLAGIDKPQEDQSMGENLSYVGTAKAKYQKNTTYNRVQTSGSDYGSLNQNSLVKTQCPKTNKYSHNASIRIHRDKLSSDKSKRM